MDIYSIRLRVRSLAFLVVLSTAVPAQADRLTEFLRSDIQFGSPDSKTAELRVALLFNLESPSTGGLTTAFQRLIGHICPYAPLKTLDFLLDEFQKQTGGACNLDSCLHAALDGLAKHEHRAFSLLATLAKGDSIPANLGLAKMLLLGTQFPFVKDANEAFEYFERYMVLASEKKPSLNSERAIHELVPQFIAAGVPDAVKRTHAARKGRPLPDVDVSSSRTLDNVGQKK